MTFKDERILKSLSKEGSPLLRLICYLKLLLFFFSMLPLSPPPGYFKEINSIILSLSGMINVPELNLSHYNILIAQEDWLYQFWIILLVVPA